MPVSRMRMRPWLEQMIDSNKITGLSWIDKDKKMFCIPWKHAARHGWELNKDACLFKEWAIHTGKYSEGNATDPKGWKANFRCAMNSLPDIEEVKDKSINKGQQAMRVFRMLPSTQKSREKRSKAKERRQKKRSPVVKREEESDYSDTQSPISMQEDSRSTQENTVDSTVQTDQNGFCFMAESDVPEFAHSVEIGPESLCHRFEVSPDHSIDYDCEDHIIEICRQLEKDTEFFTFGSAQENLRCQTSATSPGSQWSDSSSETEEVLQYTTLGTDFLTNTDNFWATFNPVFPEPLL